MKNLSHQLPIRYFRY